LSEAVFRIDAISPRDVARGICALGELALERDARAALLVVPAHAARDAVALLGRCGVSATPSQRTPPPERAIAAVVPHLAPIHLDGMLDRVWVRAIDVGHATRLAQRVLRGYDAERLRTFLRDADRAYRWRRVMWVPRGALRAPQLRGVRPIVFDREAISSGHERWGFTRDADLAAWIAG